MEFMDLYKHFNSLISVRGPKPGFDLYHLVAFLMILDDRKFLSRREASTSLGIGEGTVRSLIRRLKRDGLIDTSKSGCFLTEKGRIYLKVLYSYISKPAHFDASQFSFGFVGVAIVGKGIADRVKNCMLVRDAAVRGGASGAITMVYVDGKFRVPSVYDDLSKEFPEVERELLKKLVVNDGDAVVFSFGEDYQKASRGAFYGVFALLLKGDRNSS